MDAVVGAHQVPPVEIQIEHDVLVTPASLQGDLGGVRDVGPGAPALGDAPPDEVVFLAPLPDVPLRGPRVGAAQNAQVRQAPVDAVVRFPVGDPHPVDPAGSGFGILDQEVGLVPEAEPAGVRISQNRGPTGAVLAHVDEGVVRMLLHGVEDP